MCPAVVLNTEETAVYKEVYGRVRNVWLTLAAAGPGTINKHLLQAMSLLLPLRRICSGGRLSRSDMQVSAGSHIALQVLYTPNAVLLLLILLASRQFSLSDRVCGKRTGQAASTCLVSG